MNLEIAFSELDLIATKELVPWAVTFLSNAKNTARVRRLRRFGQHGTKPIISESTHTCRRHRKISTTNRFTDKREIPVQEVVSLPRKRSSTMRQTQRLDAPPSGCAQAQ